jgi:hypothetical protein
MADMAQQMKDARSAGADACLVWRPDCGAFL